MRNKLLFLLPTGFVVLAAAFMAPMVAHAAGPYEVTVTTDGVDMDTSDGVCANAVGDCTLRAAVMQANADGQATTITFLSTIGTLTTPVDLSTVISTNDETDGDLDVDAPLTIQGNSTYTYIYANAGDRVFEVDSNASLVLNNLNISGGIALNGGAIYNDGILSLNSSLIEATGATTAGGAIYNTGTLNINQSTIQNCSASISGAVHNVGILTIQNSLISTNSATSFGGAIRNMGSGFAQIENTSINSNTAVSAGAIDNFGQLTLDGVTLASNAATSAGGAVYNRSTASNFVFTDSTFSGNSSSEGGGIYSAGPMNGQTSTISSNTASTDGGGIFLDDANSGTLLTNVTMSGNSAAENGGGIALGSNAIDHLNLTHVSIMDNIADSDADHSGDGGGLYLGSTAPTTSLNVNSSFIARNADLSPSSIVANDVYGTVTVLSNGYNVVGTSEFDQATYWNAPGTGNDQFDMDASLDLHVDGLTDNGGDTETVTFGSNTSIAIDLVPGDNMTCQNITTDQRGQLRNDGACDAGAVEYQYDGDADGTVEANDCDDANAQVYQESTLYIDNDGDGFAGETTDQVCYGASVPTGYTTDSKDQCDADVDTQVTLEYVLDADGDSYADSEETFALCPVDASGHILAADSLGLDFDPTDPNVTTEPVVTTPRITTPRTTLDLTALDVTSRSVYNANVVSMTGERDGVARVTLVGGRVLNHQLFDQGVRKLKVKVLPESGVGIAIDSSGKRMKMFNPYTGVVYDSVRLSKKLNKARNVKFFNLRREGKKAVVTLKKKKNGKKARVVVVAFNTENQTLTLRGGKNITDAKSVRVKKTKRGNKENRIVLRTGNGKKAAVLKVQKSYKLKRLS